MDNFDEAEKCLSINKSHSTNKGAAYVAVFFNNQTKIIRGLTFDGIIDLSSANMNSDSWGPVRFLIAFPEQISPNYPNGLPEYQYLKFQMYHPKAQNGQIIDMYYTSYHAS